MKKQNKVILAGVAVFFVVFAGMFFFKSKKANDMTNISDDGSKSVFTSIKDALSKNITLVCEFKDESGISTKSYIKNGAVRVSSEGEIIMKDQKMYMWDIKTKKGFVYDVPNNESSDDKVGMTGSEVVKSEQYLDMIETYKDSCKVSSVDDSHFAIPEDVDFQDMSKFLEDLKNQMPLPQTPQQ